MYYKKYSHCYVQGQGVSQQREETFRPKNSLQEEEHSENGPRFIPGFPRHDSGNFSE